MKLENLCATPTLSSLEKIVCALETNIASQLAGGETTRQREIEELMKDDFVVQLRPSRRT